MLLVHLSDIHISVREHGGLDRAADLAALGSQLLHGWSPAAVIVSGDLVEAKNRLGYSLQNEAEWQVRL